jgi:hypothetical protein
VPGHDEPRPLQVRVGAAHRDERDEELQRQLPNGRQPAIRRRLVSD